MTRLAALPPPRRRLGPGLAALAALVGLSACQSTQPVTTSSIYPSDTRDRHPIVLTDGSRILDVFVEGPNGITPRERQDLADFGTEYRRFGTGPFVAQVPSGANPHTQRALAAVQGATGLPLRVSYYQPADPRVASPIRLTFRRLQAKVASQCGLWPQDLGVADPGFSWRNEEYWNFGCATRSTFAAQVDDPVDLVRGRRETPPDIGRRMHNFAQVRQGQDPSTSWKAPDVSTSAINQ